MARKLLRWLAWTLALALAALLLLQCWYFAHLLWYRSHNPEETAFMAMRRVELRAKSQEPRIRQQWLPYQKISVHLKRAMIAAEDAKFVDHEGFDWDGIQRALEKNQKKGRVVAGGSTISQQLAKNLFLSGSKSYLRKGEEALITVMMEAVLEKQRIFEIYLNVIEWGNGVFGAEAAARHYFGVSAADLSAEQAARLAAMAPNPRFYDKHRETKGLAKKIPIIMQRMPGAELP
ncbi:monofunctional glycosyltransferase [Burkholderiales bacterium]|nr:MAG: monofunctional biosynthetic peptidoglycan transglycosylase [Burkholderiales bacterium]CAG0966054.1 monofunctional glycosyltransferase [Burkholderiales bacterium]